MKIKKNPKQNLENYSNVFTLLGLVLSLFITLIFIEQKTYASEKPHVTYNPSTLKIDEVTSMVNVIKEKKKQPKTEKPKDIIEPKETQTKPVDLIDPTKFKKTDNNTDIIEKPIISTDVPVDIPSDLEGVEFIDIPEDAGVETIPFMSVDNIPVFPGCEKYINNNEKSKKCFNKNMAKFFGKNFDLGIAEELNLYGMQKINCQFIINSKGEISPDIQTTKTHPELAKEIKDVIKKLPKMIPAKQNGKPVNLIYMLPVRFHAE
ncbi:energy transducer TonB [Wenyingzhuangia sp. IMCC45467]